MHHFIELIEKTLAEPGEAAHALVSAEQSDHPDRYHVGLALLARAEGDLHGFRKHLEKANTLLQVPEPRVKAMLEEAREAVPRLHADAAAFADPIFTREPSEERPCRMLDDLFEDIELELDEPGDARQDIDDSTDPDSLERHLACAFLAGATGKIEDFEAALEQARALAPKHPRVLSFDALRVLGSAPEFAEQSARAALEVDDSPRSWEAFAKVLLLTGRFELAADAFAQATRRDATRFYPALGMAMSLQRTQPALDPVLAELQRAFLLEPEDPRPIAIATSALEEAGWAQGTLELLEQARQHTPDDHPTLGAMCELMMLWLASRHPLPEHPLGSQELHVQHLRERIPRLSEVAAASFTDALDAWERDDARLADMLWGGLRNEHLDAIWCGLEPEIPQVGPLAQALTARLEGQRERACLYLAQALAHQPLETLAPYGMHVLLSLFAPAGGRRGGRALADSVGARPDTPGVLLQKAGEMLAEPSSTSDEAPLPPRIDLDLILSAVEPFARHHRPELARAEARRLRTLGRFDLAWAIELG